MDNRTVPERLAAIEVKITVVCKQTSLINQKLDRMIPHVDENSWWIEKIKWAFVFITIVSVIGGIVTLAIRS